MDKTAFDWKNGSSKTFMAREEKSRPGFKNFKGQADSLAGASTAGDFKLKPMLTYYSETPRTFKNYVKSTLPVLCKWNNEAWMTAYLFTTWFTEYFKPNVKSYCSEKSFL